MENQSENPPAAEKAEPESKLTVLIAFGVNFLVATAKTIAAVISGSASMTAEAAHSWADTVNQVFLLIANRRSVKKRDRSHPSGYGREAYVWSMFAAVGLFAAGAVFSIMHGIQALTAPESEAETGYTLAYIVLAVALVLESTSFAQALRQARADAAKQQRGTLEHVVITSDTTLRAVFAEDSAALIGLLIAFAGLFTHQVTGMAVFDAVGSILIGLLLAVIAIILIEQNRRFLVGQAVEPAVEQRALAFLLEQPEIDKVTYIHLEFVGPRRLYLVAAVDMTGNHQESDVAVKLRQLEARLEDREIIEEAVLTLSSPDEQPLHQNERA